MSLRFISSVRNLLYRVFSLRWSASFCLFVCADVATYLMLIRISSQGINIPGLDKVFHVLTFFGLSVLGGMSLRHDFNLSKRFSLYSLNMMIWSFYGALIEVLQGWSGLRYADYYDLLADFIGAVLGSWFIFSGPKR